ncbi:MAG TPA: 50S ribosomal protein L29 [Polyangia bacterium]
MTKKNSLLGTIRESSDGELKDRIKRLEEELFQHRLKRFTNQLENTNLIRSARREIARCRTVLSARSHGSEQAQAKQPQAEEK